MNKVGFCYHPYLRDDKGRRVAEELRALARPHVEEGWIADAWDEEETRRHLPGTDLVVCLGGDGTILRAARAGVPHEALILPVNMGRLGFLAELDVDDARRRLPDVLAGAGRVEEHAMLHAQVVQPDGGRGGETPARHDALNDVVVGRVSLGRTLQIYVRVDGSPMGEFRADGVIVATATGSTGYSLSVGGPVLPPESSHMLVTLLSPHLAPRNSVVVPPSSVVEVELAPGQQATFSVDGERDIDLAGGQAVRVEQSDSRARFLRLSPPAAFFERLAQRLNWLRPDAAREGRRAAFDPNVTTIGTLHEETRR